MWLRVRRLLRADERLLLRQALSIWRWKGCRLVRRSDRLLDPRYPLLAWNEELEKGFSAPMVRCYLVKEAVSRLSPADVVREEEERREWLFLEVLHR